VGEPTVAAKLAKNAKGPLEPVFGLSVLAGSMEEDLLPV